MTITERKRFITLERNIRESHNSLNSKLFQVSRILCFRRKRAHYVAFFFPSWRWIYLHSSILSEFTRSVFSSVLTLLSYDVLHFFVERRKRSSFFPYEGKSIIPTFLPPCLCRHVVYARGTCMYSQFSDNAKSSWCVFGIRACHGFTTYADRPLWLPVKKKKEGIVW